MRRPVAFALLAIAALSGGCGSGPGSSAANTPAQFAAEAGRACLSVGPRLKQTSTAVTALNASQGNPLDKLPKLAGLLGQLDREFTDLHRRLGAIAAPAAQRDPYTVFVSDLDKLERLTAQGTALLKPGTISGLRQFKALGPQLDAATAALSRDAVKVPGLAACNKLS